MIIAVGRGHDDDAAAAAAAAVASRIACHVAALKEDGSGSSCTSDLLYRFCDKS